jgi:L-ascorbate metabolism protein UlaG (beta-lactamase superfamily)
MRVTLLGHACVLVELEGASFLMDPVFDDPFEDGAVVSCPRRAVDVEKLPPLEGVILSHQHLDHFDIPSLARLPPKTRVICPKDEDLVYALQRLGFEVHDTAPMVNLKGPSYELLTTHSNVSNVIELGVVFKDRTGTFWNQVDTVLAPQTIERAREHVGRIDLMFAMYASQNFGFFESKPVSFPVSMHELNLRTVVAVDPRVVVPAAAGFRFCGAVEWCNPFLFPMSRERFVADLAIVAPQIEARIANPGDVFVVDGGSVRHLPGASPVARTIEDDTALLRFDPTAAVPPLTDPNADGYALARLQAAAETCANDLADFFRATYARGDDLVAEYRRLRASYSLRIVFPDGDERAFRFRFDGPRLGVETGAAAEAPADAYHRIAASALTAWLARERSYMYRRAFSRRASHLYALARDEGRVAVEARPVGDLLTHFLDVRSPLSATAMRRWIDRQIDLASRSRAAPRR